MDVIATIIRQSTAITVALGPFVDDTDGKTSETALTITQPDIRLSKNGAAFAQKNAAQTLTHMENGYYSLSLDTTDTNTVGVLIVHCIEAGALPVFHHFQVIEEAVYDQMFTANATGAAPISTGGIVAASFATDAITASAIAASAIGSSELADNAITNTKLASGSITSSQFASGAITAAAVATDAIGAAELATDAVTEIADAVLAALKEQDRRGVAQGAGTGSNTLVLAAGDQKPDNFYNGAIIVLLEGTGTSGLQPAQRTRRITAYANSSNQVTVDSNWASAPAAGTAYLIIGG